MQNVQNAKYADKIILFTKKRCDVTTCNWIASHSHCYMNSSHSQSQFRHIPKGNPMGVGIPFPCTSLIRRIVALSRYKLLLCGEHRHTRVCSLCMYACNIYQMRHTHIG